MSSKRGWRALIGACAPIRYYSINGLSLGMELSHLTTVNYISKQRNKIDSN